MITEPDGGSEIPSDTPLTLISRLEASIIRHAGGIDLLRRSFPQLIRRAIDEVIDPARSRRFTLSELTKTEKTYIGTKVEILLRDFLKIPTGKVLDLNIDGVEADIKNTIGNNWSIPNEAMGHPCILVRIQEQISPLCSLGLLLISNEMLNLGRNRDGKRTVSKAGIARTHWILKDAPYPENFWERLPREVRLRVMQFQGGRERLAELFRSVQRMPISRNVVQAVAQQDDYMKRIRRNGGARDLLAAEGIAILWGGNDRALITQLGLPYCGNDCFISVQPSNAADFRLLKDQGHID